MSHSLVPTDFEVPLELRTDEFVLEPLTIHHVVKDYDAVITSVEHLQGVFGHAWPTAELTLEQNLIDLGWHQKEFQRRHSFAYTMLTLDRERCLGCVYLYPSEERASDVDAYLWVRASERDSGLDGRLFETVRGWLTERWPFSAPRFPSRDPATGERLT